MKTILVVTWCRAPPNCWVCGPSVIQLFAPPLPACVVGLHRLGYFRQWVPKTSRLWVSEVVMGFETQNGVRDTSWGEKCIKGKVEIDQGAVKGKKRERIRWMREMAK